ncbi:MAG: hypothetical protein WBC62_06870, partial [Candidatus Macondimonas sp.]
HFVKRRWFEFGLGVFNDRIAVALTWPVGFHHTRKAAIGNTANTSPDSLPFRINPDFEVGS